MFSQLRNLSLNLKEFRFLLQSFETKFDVLFGKTFGFLKIIIFNNETDETDCRIKLVIF